MKMGRLVPLFLVAVLGVGMITGCSTTSAADSAGKTVIKIASQTPLSGSSATAGEAIKNGAQLAVNDYKKKFAAKGFDLRLVPYDDQADPKKGVANAQLMAADPQVLGVVGHYNSGVAIPSSEIYEKNNLAMVSPAATATAVTDRGLKTVNRVVARDDFQGPAGADFAMRTLKAKKIFVIQDKTAYGSGLAEQFRKRAQELGAEIVGYEGITVGEKDFSGVISQAVSKKPDLLYFGGLYTEGGQIIMQARTQGLNMPILSDDGLASSETVQIAGNAVKNVYITSTASDVTKTAKGKNFAQRYKNEFQKTIESFSAYGYDSAAVLLEGILNAIDKNGGKLPTRPQVVQTVRATKNFNGVATKVRFDNKGDNIFAKVYIFNFDKVSYPPVQVAEMSH